MLLAAMLPFVFFPQAYVFLHQHPDPYLAPSPAWVSAARFSKPV
jgi:hypothetical protein